MGNPFAPLDMTLTAEIEVTLISCQEAELSHMLQVNTNIKSHMEL